MEVKQVSELVALGAEVRGLLREAHALAGRAATALDAGDSEEVVHLLQQRSEVVRRADAALGPLKEAASSPTHMPSSPDFDRLLTELAAAAAELQPREASLALALETERDRIARELDQIESDETVRSAYGKRTREQAKINIVL